MSGHRLFFLGLVAAATALPAIAQRGVFSLPAIGARGAGKPVAVPRVSGVIGALPAVPGSIPPGIQGGLGFSGPGLIHVRRGATVGVKSGSPHKLFVRQFCFAGGFLFRCGPFRTHGAILLPFISSTSNSNGSVAESASQAGSVPAGAASGVEGESVFPWGEAASTENRPTLLVLKSGAILLAREYWLAGERIFYVTTDGVRNSVPLPELDWEQTVRLNSERGMPLLLRPARPQTFWQPRPAPRHLPVPVPVRRD